MTERQAVLLEISRLKRNLRVLKYKPKTSFDFPSQIFDIEEFSLNDVSLIIEHGNKRLALSFFDWPNSEFIHAGTKLDKVEGAQKMPKDTTWVYRETHEIMQRVANHCLRPVMYLFYTGNDGLARWAVDKNRGASIFNWDSKIVADRFYALKIIEPEPYLSSLP